MVAVYEKSTASTIPGPRAGLPRRCLKGLGRCFKLIPTCEGKEPEPASEGATAVVRNATQNLQEVQVLRGDSGDGVFKNRRQRCRREVGEMRSSSSEKRVDRIASPSGAVI